MARHKDWDWNIPEHFTWQHVEVALLMDISDELKALNRTLQCPNTQRIPIYLRRIASNTTKRKRKK